MKKIFDIENQVEQVLSDCLESGYVDNYLMVKEGLLYITGHEDMQEQVEQGKYSYLGLLFYAGDKVELKHDIEKLIEEFNEV